MARTESNPLSELLAAVGKGIMQLPVEMEKQREVQRQNALTNFQLIQQQQQQQQSQQESALRQHMTRLQMAELNEKMRRAAMEPYMTEKQRMALKQQQELEQIQARAKAEQANKIATLRFLIDNKVNNQGKPTGATDITKFIPQATQILGQNRLIAQANAATRAKDTKAASDAMLLGETPPPPTDTIPHIQIKDIMLPMMLGAGVDSSQANQFLQGFSNGGTIPQLQMLSAHQSTNPLDNLSVEDIANLSDEQLKALIQ